VVSLATPAIAPEAAFWAAATSGRIQLQVQSRTVLAQRRIKPSGRLLLRFDRLRAATLSTDLNTFIERSHCSTLDWPCLVAQPAGSGQELRGPK
jgi:hypothetical protein